MELHCWVRWNFLLIAPEGERKIRDDEKQTGYNLEIAKTMTFLNPSQANKSRKHKESEFHVETSKESWFFI